MVVGETHFRKPPYIYIYISIYSPSSKIIQNHHQPTQKTGNPRNSARPHFAKTMPPATKARRGKAPQRGSPCGEISPRSQKTELQTVPIAFMELEYLPTWNL